MGTIIGRNGLKIKAIQDGSGTRMIASKDMLPQSTERIVEVQGSPEAIGRAIEEIGKCLLDDWERGTGTVLFHPGTGDERSGANRRSVNGGYSGSYSGSRRSNGDSNARGRASPPASPVMPHSPVSPQPAANLRTQNISIPSDMVGCIIGRSGTKITEIRRLSGSKISIAKAPHDETGERMFTIIGTPEANEKALFLCVPDVHIERFSCFFSLCFTGCTINSRVRRRGEWGGRPSSSKSCRIETGGWLMVFCQPYIPASSLFTPYFPSAPPPCPF